MCQRIYRFHCLRVRLTVRMKQIEPFF
jgi:hypothetical protein